MPDPVVWGFKAIKPFNAEHPLGSGTLVHYDPGDEVPASDWGRAEGFMVEAGTIMRYARNVLQVPNPLPPTTVEEPVVVPVGEPLPPDAEEPVTFEENSRRGAAARAPATHCQRGHELTEANTYQNGGRRGCLACRRMRDARRGTRPKGKRSA